MRKLYTKITSFEVNPDAALHRKLTVHWENESGNLTLSATKVCSSKAVGPHSAALVQQLKLLCNFFKSEFLQLPNSRRPVFLEKETVFR